MLLRILIIVLLITPRLLGQQAPAEVSAKLTLVRSADAPGHIDQSRLARVFWQLIREQKLQTKELPRVLVLHVSRKTASLVGIHASTVRIDQRKEDSGEGYYQLWLVGEPITADYVVGLQTVLEHEFGLPRDEEALKDILTRVAIQDMATVDAGNLAGK